MTLKEQTDLLGWKDITTNRQKRNGTIIYRLPIIKYGQFIKVGSFKSGYVRRMNGGYTPYQLNKREKYSRYHEYYNTNPGTYYKIDHYNRILIPDELDRIEYLITYCLKNFYINQANMIENGQFVPKWKHEYEMKNGSIDKVRELQEENRELRKRFEETAMELDRNHFEKNDEAYNNGFNDGKEEPEVSVIVNGHRYKVI